MARHARAQASGSTESPVEHGAAAACSAGSAPLGIQRRAGTAHWRWFSARHARAHGGRVRRGPGLPVRLSRRQLRLRQLQHRRRLRRLVRVHAARALSGLPQHQLRVPDRERHLRQRRGPRRSASVLGRARASRAVRAGGVRARARKRRHPWRQRPSPWRRRVRRHPPISIGPSRAAASYRPRCVRRSAPGSRAT